MLAISLSELECLRLSDCVLIRYAICDKNISLRSKEGRKQSLHEIISWRKRRKDRSQASLLANSFLARGKDQSSFFWQTSFLAKLLSYPILFWQKKKRPKFLGQTSFLANHLLATEAKTKFPWSSFIPYLSWQKGQRSKFFPLPNFFLSQCSIDKRIKDKSSLVKLIS